MSLDANDAVVDTVEGAPLSQQNVQSSSWMLDSQDGDGNSQERVSSPVGSDYEDAEPRDNRFQGSASTWRHCTAEELALATHLDQLRAGDLSVHLYNAHALKARLYKAQAADDANLWSSKQQWMQRNENDEIAWHPGQHWTAWPMSAEDVPRLREDTDEPSDEDGLRSLATATTPAEDLDGEVLAAMLRDAKGRFRRRTWISDPSIANAVPKDMSEPPLQIQHAKLSAHDPAHDTRYDVPQFTVDVPQFSADDEVASTLLRPAVSHVMSKLDDLLIALHRSRLGHVKSSHAEADQSDRTKARKRKRRDPAEVDEISAEKVNRLSSSSDSQVATGKSSSRPSGRQTLRCRDWSEVLGMAALTGWDSAVLDRTATRCSNLFGEEMSFRVMPETKVIASADREVQYRPALVPDLDCETDLDDSSDHSTADDSYTCPGARSTSDTPDDTPDALENERMIGGVHLDGFMLSVTARLVRGKDRSPRKKRGVDYKKLAGLAGMTNPISASNAWSKICKKLQAQAGGVGDNIPAATPKAARGKKCSKADDAKEDGDAEEDEESPTKKTKPTAKGKRGTKVKVEQEGSASPEKDDGEEENFML
ncbi:hypothetical protein B0A48_06421 [Cryoendolithus antarcticus]|uniref:Rrn9 domain-containing protein n=1 Tax=Cryoendolithus antarcticus TaxID=1507870 RepID=A0A1V8TBC5_9PEZI|nr:hypothetical protein B0A48_06421 [Cryoendolithus antarcticus]